MDKNKDNRNESWVLIPTHNSITNFIYQGHYFWVSRKKATFQNDDKKSIKRTDSSGDTFIGDHSVGIGYHALKGSGSNANNYNDQAEKISKEIRKSLEKLKIDND